MRRCIAILEDNEDRIAAMRRCLADKFPFFDLRFFRSANKTNAWLTKNFAAVICLCLDHDLEPTLEEPAIDPGTGRDVVEVLVRAEPRFPVIIHTTNQHAAIAMEAQLQENGWSVQRLSPYGDLAWVAESWLPAVRQAIVEQAIDAPAATASQSEPRA